MLTIEQVARVAHEANRAYCLALGDEMQSPWDVAPTWQRESTVLGVQAMLEGTATDARTQHEYWCETQRAHGWTYGPSKDAGTKTHPCLVPYADLPPEQQVKDRLFRAVVAALADRLSRLVAEAARP